MTLASDYMSRALFHAARGRGRTSPKPMAGAVVVSAEGVVVGQGYRARAGSPHAEVHALGQAGPRACGGTLYCTLEPCGDVGRTGGCVPLIIEAGIARVVASVEDPNPLVGGRGFAQLRAHGVEVEVGPGAEQALSLNRSIFTLLRTHRPYVILKAAVSLDGCLAAEPGRRTLLTSAVANRHAQCARAEVDAIGVGAGTILADDPLLTARGPYRERPLTRVIFDRRLRTPPEARVISTRDAGPVIILTTGSGATRLGARRRLEAAGAEVEVCSDATFAQALACLATRRISSLLLEGGGVLHQAAWDEGLVDFVRLYVTPQALGPRGVRLLPCEPWLTRSLRGRLVQQLGPDVLIEGYVHRTD